MILLFSNLIFNEKDEILRNYIRGSDFFVSPNTWKKIEVRHQLPFIHQKMLVKSYIFSPSLKSKLHFIVEYYDSGKVDYYFTSPEESTNKSLQEDIGSFFTCSYIICIICNVILDITANCNITNCYCINSFDLYISSK